MRHYFPPFPRRSNVLEATLASRHTPGLFKLFTHLLHTVGLLLMSNQPVAETSTYTRQHNTTRTNIHALSEIRTHDLSIQTTKACDSDRAATGTG
jgi:hypothetical protein